MEVLTPTYTGDLDCDEYWADFAYEVRNRSVCQAVDRSGECFV